MKPSAIILIMLLVISAAACDPFSADSGDGGGGCYSDGCDISGYVRTEAGRPLKDVKVALSGGEGGYVVTDRNGYYRLSKNVMTRDYCVTPSKGPWEFDPDKRCYKDLARNYNDQDFVAIHVDSFEISGQVVTMRGPKRDVMLFLTGAKSANTRTNSQGFYSFPGLRGREDYCVTPALEGYTFEPVQLCYTYLDSTFDDEDYLATETGETGRE